MKDRKLSVAASAILRHIAEGNWIGASWPHYIPEVRRLGAQKYRAAWQLAVLRAINEDWSLNQKNQRNFNDAAWDADNIDTLTALTTKE
jgi:hypothetical protein